MENITSKNVWKIIILQSNYGIKHLTKKLYFILLSRATLFVIQLGFSLYPREQFGTFQDQKLY